MYSPANKTSAHVRCLTVTVLIVATAGCEVERPNFEYVYLPGTEIDSGANLPFTPAIKVRGGSIVFLSGITGAPVPHSHPHIPAEFDHLDFSAEAQTEAVMQRLQVTRFVVDIGNNQVAVNAVMNRYWGNHRPASTSVEIVRLATDPRFILEVEAVAVIPD